MRKKCFIMAMVSFLIAIGIYVLTYYMYHYLGPDCCFGRTYNCQPAKPMLTLFFGIWGVLHQFAAVICLLLGLIFFKKEKS